MAPTTYFLPQPKDKKKNGCPATLRAGPGKKKNVEKKEKAEAYPAEEQRRGGSPLKAFPLSLRYRSLRRICTASIAFCCSAICWSISS